MNGNSRPIRKRRWPLYLGAAVALWAALAMVFDFFPEQEKELRRGLRTAVQNTFPQQAADVAKSFGLTHYVQDSAPSSAIDPALPTVVLIHGLDDPGKAWMNLAPVLSDNHVNVWQLRYPNDQPIVDSARFFYEELAHLKQSGVDQISIVAHSMGGLVSREMLTDPQLAYIDRARAGELPRVAALIMVGTPNHGSELARFRVLGELRDQWVNFINGRGHVLGGILDGAGEAKIDLLPDSQFLQTLNRRPHPDGVKMLSIAGIISPWEQRDIDQFLDANRENMPAAGQAMLVDMADFLKSMSDGLGDGLVTVESTRLNGVEHQTVSGTHLSMIRNISEQSTRVPPAVPLIVNYLGQIYLHKTD